MMNRLKRWFVGEREAAGPVRSTNTMVDETERRRAVDREKRRVLNERVLQLNAQADRLLS